MIDESEFEFKGVKYISVPEGFGVCSDCALLTECSPNGIKGVPGCQAWKREDRRNVVFVEKQP